MKVRQGSGSKVLFNFCGDDLREGSGSQVVCNISGNKVRKGSGSSVVLNVQGDSIRQGSGSRVLFNLKGDKICEGSGSRVVLQPERKKAERRERFENPLRSEQPGLGETAPYGYVRSFTGSILFELGQDME